VNQIATQTIGDRTPARVEGRTVGARAIEAIERNAFVIAALAVCAGAQVAFLRSAVQSDTWYTLVSGRLVWRSGIPRHDTLTALTAGRSWVDEQWLAQLAFFGLWAAGRMVLALFALVVLYTGSFAILAAGARMRHASARSVALVTGVCFLVGLPNTILRAQVPAYLLLALVLVLLLADDRQTSRRVYLTLPILALWANVHGSVLTGAALVSLYGATVLGRAFRRRGAGWPGAARGAALLVVPWACVLATPYGFDLPGYYRSVLDNPSLAHSVSEWGPSTLRGQPFFFALLLAGTVTAALGRRGLTPFAMLAFASAGILGLLAIRNIVWFALVASAVLPSAVDTLWRPSDAQRRATVNLALAAAGIAFFVVMAAAVASRGDRWLESGYPARAASVVSGAALAEPGARIFADERYADWLLFEDPSLAGRVAYDVRFELLTKSQLDRIVAFRLEHGSNWLQAADGYRLIVLDPKADAGAVKTLREQRGTSVLYRNGEVVVLERGAR
jgi:hypothetical protein